MAEEQVATVREDCRHGMGNPSWCALCEQEQAIRPAPDDVRPTARAFSIGAATARGVDGHQQVHCTPRGSDEPRTGQVSVWEVTVGGQDRLDVQITSWPGYPTEITGRFRHGPERLIGIHKRHALLLKQHSRGWWSSLTNQSLFDPTEPDRPSKRTPTLRQLAEGADIDDAALELERLGGRILRRRSLGKVKRGGDSQVLLGAVDNETVHVASYVISRLLPVYLRYEG